MPRRLIVLAVTGLLLALTGGALHTSAFASFHPPAHVKYNAQITASMDADRHIGDVTCSRTLAGGHVKACPASVHLGSFAETNGRVHFVAKAGTTCLYLSLKFSAAPSRDAPCSAHVSAGAGGGLLAAAAILRHKAWPAYSG